MLPDHRDAEMRRVPLEINQPGVYLVEAVSRPAARLHHRHRVGHRPGHQDRARPDAGLRRRSVQRRAARRLRRPGARRPEADRQRPDRRRRRARRSRCPRSRPTTIVGVAQCGDQVAATDPGRLVRQQPARELVGYVYTDKPIYRPGHTVHLKAICAGASATRSCPSTGPRSRSRVSDTNDKVVFRRTMKVDAFGAVAASFPVPRDGGARQLHRPYRERRRAGAGRVRGAGIPPARVRGDRHARHRASSCRADEAVASVQARYYFGQPVANARVRYVVNQQAYYSPLRWNDEVEGDAGSGYLVRRRPDDRGRARLDAQGRGEIRVPLGRGRERTRLQRADRSAGDRRQQPRGQRQHRRARDLRRASCSSTRVGGYIFSPAQPVPVSVRALDYPGTPQPSVPVTLVLEQLTYPSGYYGDPAAAAVGAARHDDRCRRARRRASVTLPSDAGSYRVRAIATSGDRSDQRPAWHLGARCARTPRPTTAIAISSCIADKTTYAPGDTARLIVRGEPVSGPVLVTKEGQHVSWYRLLRPSATDAIEVPIEAATSATSTSTSSTCARAGCTAPSAGCRCPPPTHAADRADRRSGRSQAAASPASSTSASPTRPARRCARR